MFSGSSVIFVAQVKSDAISFKIFRVTHNKQTIKLVLNTIIIA